MSMYNIFVYFNQNLHKNRTIQSFPDGAILRLSCFKPFQYQ